MLDQAHAKASRGVEKYAHHAKIRQDGGRDSGQVAVASQVCTVSVNVGRKAPTSLCNFFKANDIPSNQGEVHSHLCECKRGGPPNTACGAGDDADLFLNNHRARAIRESYSA